MDRISALIGILLLAAAFVFLSWGVQKQKQASPETNFSFEHNSLKGSDGDIAVQQGKKEADPSSFIFTNSPSTIGDAEEVEPVEAPKLVFLANEFIRVGFSLNGGGLQEVELLKYPAIKEGVVPYRFDTTGNAPALALSYSRDGRNLKEFAPRYEVIEKTDSSITLRSEVGSGIELIRRYELSNEAKGASPYTITHSTRFINHSDTNFDIQELYLNVGSAAPTEADPQGWYLNFAHYNGDKARFINLSKFKASNGFLGIGRRSASETIQGSDTLRWASVKNQFFTAVATPSIPAKGYLALPVQLTDNNISQTMEGVSGNLLFGFNQLRAGTERTLDVSYYIGPKEYSRLKELDQRQHLIMQFGFFGLFSRWLLTALNGLEGLIGNYGLAIIAMTVIIRLFLWPLTAQSARASQRMADLQKPLKELRERLKDKPEKLRKETVKLFKEYQVNPASGCIPILIQIPIFIAFFYMLRTASELRFAEFLWIKDLSQPENLFSWGIHIPLIGDSFNLLPLLMGVSMFYLMRKTPSTIDRAQQMMLQYVLPIVFTAICYTFSSGLVLYWTTSNALSILQQILIRRQQQKVALDQSQPPSPANKSQPVQLKGKKRKSRRPALATSN